MTTSLFSIAFSPEAKFDISMTGVDPVVSVVDDGVEGKLSISYELKSLASLAKIKGLLPSNAIADELFSAAEAFLQAKYGSA